MSNTSDFVIEKGVLEIYRGNETVVEIPDSVTKIGTRAFLWSDVTGFTVSESSNKLKSENGIILSKDGKKLILYPPKGDMSQCVIPDTVEQISGGAFRGMDSDGLIPRWIMIPKSVIKMTKNAFTFVPEFGGFAFAFVYNKDFVELIPSPVYLGDLNDLTPKEKNKAVVGFLQAIRFERSEILPYKASYIEHIRNNIKTYIKWTYDEEPVFHFFVQEKLIPKNWVSKVLNALESENRPDLIAELLEYQEVNFGSGDKKQLSLSEDDPELKSRIKMEKRREEIKNQKGIKGIVFVVTGDLDQFGTIDTYDGFTDIPDRSDLKAFIEERGGYLRSAVSTKTDYLICNDPDNESEKSKQAKELGVTIISESEFLKMVNETE